MLESFLLGQMQGIEGGIRSDLLDQLFKRPPSKYRTGGLPFLLAGSAVHWCKRGNGQAQGGERHTGQKAGSGHDRSR